MKTYIVSNGRRYSDHEVLFVEVQEGQDRVIPLFLDFCSRNQGEIYGIQPLGPQVHRRDCLLRL